MSLHLWLAYTGIIIALIAIPGPSALISMSHGLRYGASRATATVLGGVSAAMILMSCSALGLGAILAASTTAFIALKIVGAVYLIWLGIASWRSKDMSTAEQDTQEASAPGWFPLFRKGFLVGISNPKDLLFFAALFPNFIDTSAPHALQLIILAVTWAVFDFSIMFIYACTGRRLSGLFSNPRRIKLFNRSTGGIFILAGTTLAASTR
ncbi:LysE family transporter [Pectobacterium brasiliense]|uniref:LysE family translocator n=1 Tax=Pectobacterium TaxID=122277 RepID=UPI0001A43067|nr:MULTISPECIES: LysE family transporter [Pectobacterium]GKV78504.1 lysine transporter LysE [Pectobacterium carotovorum subsp. carotovorum]APS28849.1 amino acid transporter [Pectobacterium brasiliense]ARA77671.1 amino acid transporter [Pectobacterium brasiliense]ATV43960.1 amino acid transporter [Pectobacterium brasiliense]KFF68150.1 amino acid transporter [Pectobacterium brasiliense]